MEKLGITTREDDEAYPCITHSTTMVCQMRVMTFNLRFDNDRDGRNAWRYRCDLVIRVILHHTPAILGTQEGTCSQIDYLRDSLPAYALHVLGRVFDDTCQYPTLFVRRDTFDITGGEKFWLSETPEVHRSKSWDSAYPRMMSYAILRSTATNKILIAAVTHLDHEGLTARIKQATILAQWRKHQTDPLILMGDFNDSPDSQAHQLLTTSEIGLADTWELLDRDEGPAYFTHHGFRGIPQKARMDWILISSHFRISDAIILRDHFDGRYPSDHFPYMVDLELA